MDAGKFSNAEVEVGCFSNRLFNPERTTIPLHKYLIVLKKFNLFLTVAVGAWRPGQLRGHIWLFWHQQGQVCIFALVWFELGAEARIALAHRSPLCELRAGKKSGCGTSPATLFFRFGPVRKEKVLN